MAYDINAGTRAQGWPEFRFPAAHFEWADQSFGSASVVTGDGLTSATLSTATSGSGDCLTGMRFFRALVYVKTHRRTATIAVAGASPNTTFYLDLADDVTFVTNYQIIGQGAIDSRRVTPVQAVTIYVIAPLTTRQFVRVRALTYGVEDGSWDCVIDAAP